MSKRLLTYSLLSLMALGGFFGNVHIDIEKSNREIISISYERSETYAEPNGCRTEAECNAKNAATSSSNQLIMWNNLIDTLNIILGIITAIVSPAIMFAGWLMSPDWTSGDIFGLRAPMYTLWVTVSNIVYFVYAILLILIALGTMFGNDSFSYRVMLPKLALGILMVPFTWWFVQWTISIASVVTASVITIPAETMQSKDGRQSWADTPSIPKNIIIDESSGDPTRKKPIEKCTATGTGCIAPSAFLGDGSGMYGYMMVYAYSVFKFHEVTQIPQGLDILKTGLGIIHQGIIAAIMFLVFGLLTIALVAILLVRAIKLWVYAIFSPLFTFQFVAGSAMMGGDKDTFTLKEFIGLAFVPAIVGLALSFGLILINAVSSDNPGLNQKKCDGPTLRTEGCEIISIAGNPKNTIVRKIQGTGTGAYTQNIVNFGGVTTTFNGKAGASTDDAVAVDSVNTVTGVFNSAGGIFGTLIIDIIALVFIWMAFMAAKTVNKTVSMAFEPFEKIGSQVGSLAKSIPKYVPIPLPGGSIAGASRAVTDLAHIPEVAANKRYENSSVGKLLHANLNIPQSEAKKLEEALKKGTVSTLDMENISKIMKEFGGRQNAHLSGAPEAFMETLKDDTKRREFFNTSRISQTDQNAFQKFYDNHKDGLKTETDKRDLMALMNTAFGKAAGGNATTGGSGTTSAAANGNGTISINGVNINYSGIKLDATPTVIGEKIATYLNAKKADMDKPSEEQIKKLVASLGVDALKEVETVKKIVEKLDSTGFKAKA